MRSAARMYKIYVPWGMNAEKRESMSAGDILEKHPYT